jgi:hypothetical protein
MPHQFILLEALSMWRVRNGFISVNWKDCKVHYVVTGYDPESQLHPLAPECRSCFHLLVFVAISRHNPQRDRDVNAAPAFQLLPTALQRIWFPQRISTVCNVIRVLGQKRVIRVSVSHQLWLAASINLASKPMESGHYEQSDWKQ